MTAEELLALLNGVPPPEWILTKMKTIKTKLSNGQELYMEKDSSTGSVWQVYLSEPSYLDEEPINSIQNVPANWFQAVGGIGQAPQSQPSQDWSTFTNVLNNDNSGA